MSRGIRFGSWVYVPKWRCQTTRAKGIRRREVAGERSSIGRAPRWKKWPAFGAYRSWDEKHKFCSPTDSASEVRRGSRTIVKKVGVAPMQPIVIAWFFLTLITNISVGCLLVVLSPSVNRLSLPADQVLRTPRGRTVALIMLASSTLSMFCAAGYLVFWRSFTGPS